MTAEQERESGALMARAQEGDQLAYVALLVLLTNATKQFARRRLGDVPWIDDVVQETLLAVHGARQTFDVRRPFAPWFYAIASNRMIDVIRRERRVSSRELGAEILPEPATGGEAPDRSGVDLDAVQSALATLPNRQRAIIEKLKYQDRSVKEIAGEMGMSESAVKVTAHRGYKALKRLLGVKSRED